MVKIGILLAAAVSLILVACGGAISQEKPEETGLTSEFSGLGSLVPGAPAPTPAPVPAIGLEVPDEFSTSQVSALESAQRQVISIASVSLEVEVVQQAVVEVRVIAESLGGFVE